jgi:type IX secretion system PorP/SprF family membrane protein
MNFKSIKLLVVFCVFSLVANSQQRPHYTQYVMNQFVINPALAGIENYWDLKASHRAQWVGLQGAPVTTYITINGPGNKDDAGRETPMTVHANGENPRGEAFYNSYTTPASHFGYGLTFMSDVTGPLVRNAASVSVAYHKSLSPHLNLSFGASVGFNQMSLRGDELNFGTVNPVDPVVGNSGYLNTYNPDISAGLWLYNSEFFIGLAAQQIIPQKLYFSDTTISINQQGQLVPHYFLTGGVRLFLSEDFNFMPSIMLRNVSPLPLGIDVNAKFQYKDQFWFGAGYRYQDGFSGMFGLNVNSTFNIGYSYDFTTSLLNTVSKGSHELMIGFLIGNKYGDLCPRNSF